MICPGCQRETSLRLSTSGKLVCPECGIAPRPGVWFCPIHGKAVHPTLIVSAGAAPRAICPDCGHEAHPWSGDLPWPTESGVRALVQANQRLAARARAAGVMEATASMEAAGQRLPGANKRGWWN
jgi:hypothetical protein